MGRIKEQYLLRKKDKKSKYYYYKLPDMEYFKSTHKKTKTEALEFVEQLLNEQSDHTSSRSSNMTFGEYSKDYFIEGKCPRTTRLRSEKGDRGPSKRYVDECRRLLETKIRPTWFSSLKMKNIKRKDVLDFRDYLRQTNTPGVVNDCMEVLRLIFNEGIFREELEYNPLSGVSRLDEKPKPKTPYTPDELRKMFPIDNEDEIIRIWKTFGDFIVEYLEFNTGMRNSEVRCLKWKNVDLDNQIIYVRESFKDEYNKIIGPPKNGKERMTGMSDNLKRMLVLYKDKYTSFTNPDDYVCCLKKSGKPLPKKHTSLRHKQGLEKAGVSYRGQHVYRHTFNSLLKGKVKDWDIQTTTGWSDGDIQKRYTHTESNSVKQITKGVNSLWKEINKKDQKKKSDPV